MTTSFNLPRTRPDPLGQALNQIPQFMLALGQLQERKADRVQRSREFTAETIQRDKAFTAAKDRQKRAEQTAEKDTFLRLLSGMSKTSGLAYLEGLDSDNPEINKARDVLIDPWVIAAREERSNKVFDKELRLDKARLAGEKADREDYLQAYTIGLGEETRVYNRELAMAKLLSTAAGQGVLGAEEAFSVQMANLLKLSGGKPTVDVPELDFDTTKPLTAGFGTVPSTLDPIGILGTPLSIPETSRRIRGREPTTPPLPASIGGAVALGGGIQEFIEQLNKLTPLITPLSSRR